ncbi:MAG: hypothetical protein ABR985_02615 [Methanotrichaceae archaeon]|jgi:hypothetical protein
MYDDGFQFVFILVFGILIIVTIGALIFAALGVIGILFRLMEYIFSTINGIVFLPKTPPLRPR